MYVRLIVRPAGDRRRHGKRYKIYSSDWPARLANYLRLQSTCTTPIDHDVPTPCHQPCTRMQDICKKIDDHRQMSDVRQVGRNAMQQKMLAGTIDARLRLPSSYFMKMYLTKARPGQAARPPSARQAWPCAAPA